MKHVATIYLLILCFVADAFPATVVLQDQALTQSDSIIQAPVSSQISAVSFDPAKTRVPKVRATESQRKRQVQEAFYIEPEPLPLFLFFDPWLFSNPRPPCSRFPYRVPHIF